VNLQSELLFASDASPRPSLPCPATTIGLRLAKVSAERLKELVTDAWRMGEPRRARR
jgi:hypothetical protein